MDEFRDGFCEPKEPVLGKEVRPSITENGFAYYLSAVASLLICI